MHSHGQNAVTGTPSESVQRRFESTGTPVAVVAEIVASARDQILQATTQTYKEIYVDSSTLDLEKSEASDCRRLAAQGRALQSDPCAKFVVTEVERYV